MNALQRGLLIVAIVLLGGAAWVWQVRTVGARVPPAAKARAVQRAAAPALPSHRFTREQGYAFAAAVKKAEAIADPLQRCLAYPDPPDSHWTRETVVAYCHFRLQPLLTFAEAQALIQQGKSAELDRRLATAFHAQQTDPAAPGLLDRIYDQAFDNGSFDIRPTLDAWKRDSPNSAFAFAASGAAYVAMAADARGSAYMKDTPDSNIRAMDNLLAQADDDLRHAIALNPKLSVAYSALIHGGAMGHSHEYVDTAIDDALAAVPDNYTFYVTAIWASEPKWGGSLEAMDRLASRAQAQRNPMLKVLRTERPFYEVWNCDCSGEAELAAYPHVVDELTGNSNLARIGKRASELRNQTMALIYQSEALRFNPGDEDARVNRAFAMIDYDESGWAAADLGRLLATSPHNARALDARARAYEMLGDYAHAEADFHALLALDPRDMGALGKLGDMYVNWARDWDKGWAVADQLIRDEPGNPYGWLLRARIQDQQPRAGLDATADALDSRFGKDPRMAEILLRMRAQVALRKHSGIDAPARAN